MNAILACLIYKIVIEPQSTNKTKDARKISESPAAFLFAFGIVFPFAVIEPLYLIDFLGITNPGLRMACLASPIVNSFRISEGTSFCVLNLGFVIGSFQKRCFLKVSFATAVFGFTPFAAKKSLKNFVIYFSCAFGILFDPATSEPKRASRKFLTKRLKTLGRDYLIVSSLFSVMKEYDFAFFDTERPAHAFDHPLQDLISWQHLLNNFINAGEFHCFLRLYFMIQNKSHIANWANNRKL
jgi:hypothetical protein